MLLEQGVMLTTMHLPVADKLEGIVAETGHGMKYLLLAIRIVSLTHSRF